MPGSGRRARDAGPGGSGREEAVRERVGRVPAFAEVVGHLEAGDAHKRSGRDEIAQRRWRAARSAGGALAVAPRPAREDDLWVGIAHLRLGEVEDAADIWAAIERTADDLEAAPIVPDYFATSLPELLLFRVDDTTGRAGQVERLRAAATQGRAATAAAGPALC